ncbi:2-oxoglutarate dehydrogenase E1 component [Candidatus Providencia siddallii]
MKTWIESSFLSAENKSYIEYLYEKYLIDNNSVSDDWKKFFQDYFNLKFNVDKEFNLETNTDIKNELKIFSNYLNKQNSVLQLIDAFRFRGHENANIDPLRLWERGNVQELNLEYYGFKKDDFNKTFYNDLLVINKDTLKLNEIHENLKRIYCGSIGIEYMHIKTDEKKWIQKRIESINISEYFSDNEKRLFLSELIAAEGLERYLNSRFPGSKRFSIEGCDVLIPLLKDLILYSNKKNVNEIVLGMAHRGRLNVLVNIFGKKPIDLFNEFEGKYETDSFPGDVKYHQGFSCNLQIDNSHMHLSLLFNPSHLEMINPVLIGSVRARRDRLENECKNFVLPIVIHGDSAITGQGIVQETLNMSQVPGYEVGGTIRIVINNQIGFTISNREETRSSEYCTDIIKMIRSPIFHVNADDLEAVIFISRLAFDFRNKFKRDVIIDLVCYRRHGHNEADEPNATQPIMYKKIRKHPTIREIYSEYLIKKSIFTKNDIFNLIKLYRDKLDLGDCVVKEHRKINSKNCIWAPYLNQKYIFDYRSNFNENKLYEIAIKINTLPKWIDVQSRVKKIYEDRLEMAEGKKFFDWGAAETLAYATLVYEKINIRISGEDVGRGTFFHRHVVIHNQKDGSIYIPLEHVVNNQGIFSIWDSVLSENAILAFEYGYAITEPRSLIIWEAQFGDFANGAQVVIDQFISSGEQKWGRMCGLVMLLPHGYEGQGPEHSSARLERYLQLCSCQNMQVCIPSTPSQVYHMLRRQALNYIRKPLIVISPKSLLRHPLAVSSINEFVDGTFKTIIGELDDINLKYVKRLIMCSGKVYYDLLEQRRKNKQKNVFIIRIEQLYPFPYEDFQKILIQFINIKDFVWCQEEPMNQGAWFFLQNIFYKIIPTGIILNYVGRDYSSSTAAGCISVHKREQQNLIDKALNIK